MMIKKLSLKVWNDLKSGENIELYLTLVLSVGTIFMSMIGYATSNIVMNLILSILALSSLSFIKIRQEISSLSSQIDRRTQYLVNLTQAKPRIDEKIRRAKTIYVMGVSLRAFSREMFTALSQALENGGVGYVLLTDPSGVVVDVLAQRYIHPITPRQIAMRINESKDVFCYLNQQYPGKVHIRKIDFPLPYGYLLLEYGDASIGSDIFIWLYFYKGPPGIHPTLHLQDVSNIFWYQHFRNDIHRLWEYGEDWLCQ